MYFTCSDDGVLFPFVRSFKNCCIRTPLHLFLPPTHGRRFVERSCAIASLPLAITETDRAFKEKNSRVSRRRQWFLKIKIYKTSLHRARSHPKIRLLFSCLLSLRSSLGSLPLARPLLSYLPSPAVLFLSNCAETLLMEIDYRKKAISKSCRSLSPSPAEVSLPPSTSQRNSLPTSYWVYFYTSFCRLFAAVIRRVPSSLGWILKYIISKDRVLCCMHILYI